MRRFILISLVGLGAFAVAAPVGATPTPSAPIASTHAFVPTDGRTASARCSVPRSSTASERPDPDMRRHRRS